MTGPARRGKPTAPTFLPPADMPDADEFTIGTCFLCPADAVVVLLRVLTSAHSDWPTWVAATVAERQACRHHADEALSAPDSPWLEVASRPVGGQALTREG